MIALAESRQGLYDASLQHGRAARRLRERLNQMDTPHGARMEMI